RGNRARSTCRSTRIAMAKALQARRRKEGPRQNYDDRWLDLLSFNLRGMTMKTITTAKRNKWFWMYLLVLLAVGIMPWTTRGANCPKYFCDNNGAYSCPAS